jgi:hypothetical protein
MKYPATPFVEILTMQIVGQARGLLAKASGVIRTLKMSPISSIGNCSSSS